ncbi:MAG: DUF3467 domain-containing protein [Holophagales bacterium]|nr:DUF3467 domain-containing protein [Holophagales bacterium]MYB18280.1 DUF3467 domain-containing protein [Holophagales bacterium]MYF93952.1 DUF3467 domain-containing protein [Holophagales bacterium]MYH25597.1 DUF3467 domain-containing protein [Holophagales bacterium]
MSDQPKEVPGDQDPSSSINVKIGDAELKGAYSNLLRITHTREEFILDFINVVPPQGIVSARIVTSPGHLKRIIRALGTNLRRYEEVHGVIEEAPDPTEQSSRVN